MITTWLKNIVSRKSPQKNKELTVSNNDGIMPQTPKYDHYKEAEHLALLLAQDGAKEYSALLLNAMIEGSTGSEICMALKWHTNNILKLDCLSKETRECAQQLWTELDKVLRW